MSRLFLWARLNLRESGTRKFLQYISVLEFLMSVRSFAKVAFRGMSIALLVTGLQVSANAVPTTSGGTSALGGFFDEQAGASGAESSRMATYDDPRGETAFALSLSPQIETVQRSSDIVIYFDTSASQTGSYKRDGIALLEKLLSSLSADDRVQLIAMDLDPVELTTGFFRVDSDEMSVAIDLLKQRVSLGSTDLELMLKSTPARFAASEQNRNVIYIGDGISRASLLNQERLGAAINGLTESRVAFSSFAIGPERNIELLAALSNNTGGNLFVDSNDQSSVDNCASGLSQTVHGSVFWPQSVSLPEQMADVFPTAMPPMRSDRDTVVLGTLSARGQFNIGVTGTLNGQPASLSWDVATEDSNADFAFLNQLISDARKDGGMSLPTIGSAGLREAARMATQSSREYSNLGQRALVSGNMAAAGQLASAALARDPSNTEATLLARAAGYSVQDDDPFSAPAGDTPAVDPPVVDAPFTDSPFDTPAETTPAEMPLQEPQAVPVDNFGAQPQDVTPVDADPFGAGNNNDPLGGVQDMTAVDPGQEEPIRTLDGAEIAQPPATDLTRQSVNDPPMVNSPVIDSPVTVESTTDSFRMVGPQDPRQFPDDDVERLLRDTRGQAGQVLDRANIRKQVITDMTRKQVEVELGRANEELRYAPDQAIQRLKSMVEILDQATEVDPNTLQDLRNRLISSLLSARQEKLSFDNTALLRAQEQAITVQHLETLRRYENREERVSTLINSFDHLLTERNFDEAYQVALEVYEYAPHEPASVLADESGRIARIATLLDSQRRERQLAFVESLYHVERSAIPLSGEPPMLFPDPLVWARKVADREKYSDIRLAGNDIDEEILTKLDQPASFSHNETPFEDVMAQIRDEYGINVVLDSSAREDELDLDTDITFEVGQIRLKNALRLMLKDYNATFIVRDEVLRIISIEVASDPENFVTNVYNVGDLVAPRQSRLGGGGQLGQGGGFGGGQQGGGGFGGGQGGFGGGQGGGGGIFCLLDEPAGQAALDTEEGDQPRKKPAVAPKAIELNIPAGSTAAEVWSNYLSENQVDPDSLRLSVKKLMDKNAPGEVVDLISAAMRHNRSQPWMIEGLVIAMQVADYPVSDIERALMSTIDLSNNLDDAMMAAKYMVDHDMQSRGIRLLQDVASISNVRPEPYVLGLSAAEEINDLGGIQWATLGILGQAWPEHRDVVKRAIFSAEAVLAQLEKEGRAEELTTYKTKLDEALYRDCIIKVTWTGEADVDLIVEEPGGSICSRRNPRTTAGGVLMGDEFTAENQSGATSEYYVLPKGFSGDYKLYIRKVWGEVAAGKVTVSIYSHFRSDKQVAQQKQLEVDDAGATLVLFSLADGRRTQSLEQHVIESIAGQDVLTTAEMNRALDAAHSSTASSSYHGGEGTGGGGAVGGGAVGGGVAPRQIPANNLQRGVVGYQPQIDLIREGASMQATATTSDRLYVLVGAAPNINQIIRVDTFNILGDAGDAFGGGTGGGGGGGGGGIGGGGGGGLF